ncbi:aryl hydrocarbon receptor nuclear translocator homolog isoform X2 [Contarinia nasturtii]|nr:aryl hydrocarbon receptor nuclear translocator homolog isoform X2 [Contarinia nasturtii]
MDDENSQDRERFSNRENHCEIERRRRNKMTAYISELADMVPACSAMTRKPDKLTILRMAVAQMRTLPGTGNSTPDKPRFLNENELTHLILDAADGFLFVVSCDEGRIMDVSDSIVQVLNQSQTDWLNTCFFDQIHPDDREKVREQLSTQEPQRSIRVLDIKTGTIKKENHQSSMRMLMDPNRRFICRMRIGNRHSEGHLNRLKQKNSLGSAGSDGVNYAVVHCTGYIRNWKPTDFPGGPQDDGRHSNYCMVALGRLQVQSTPKSDLSPQIEFISRHSIDGKFTFVDQRVKELLDYTTIDLLGKNYFDFIHPDDCESMKEIFDRALKHKDQPFSLTYRFRSKICNWIRIHTETHAFRNPFSNAVEYIVCKSKSAEPMAEPMGNTTPNAVQFYDSGISEVDYALQQQVSGANDFYNAQGMISHTSPQSNVLQSNTEHTMGYGYESTQSPIAYGTCQQQPVSAENLQYNVSPTCSPDAPPTYTQLNGSYAQQSPPQPLSNQNYQNQPNTAMWDWQTNQSEQGSMSVVTLAGPTHAINNSNGELNQMFTILDQTGGNSFDDLNMFTNTYQ